MPQLSEKEYFDQLQSGFFGVIAKAGGVNGFAKQLGGIFGAGPNARPDAIVRALTWVMAMTMAQCPDGDERRRNVEDQGRVLGEFLTIADGKLAASRAGFS